MDIDVDMTSSQKRTELVPALASPFVQSKLWSPLTVENLRTQIPRSLSESAQ